MEKISSLNLSFDRVLIQLIVPGIVSISTWIPVIVHDYSSLKNSTFSNFLYSNGSIAASIVVICALIAGMILENLGSLFESRLIDRILKSNVTYSDLMDVWDKYLQIDFGQSEPVGQRYLRNILMRLKFELSFGIALFPATIGLISLNHNQKIFEWTCFNCLLFYILPFLIALYLLFCEALQSAKILANTRKLLVEKYYK